MKSSDLLKSVLREMIKENRLLRESSVLDRLEKIAGPLNPGRNTIMGIPVDIPDQEDPHESLAIVAVDEDGARDLLKGLREKGFKTRFDKKRKWIVVS